MKRKTSNELIQEYIRNGGNVTKCKDFNTPGSKAIRINGSSDSHSIRYQRASR